MNCALMQAALSKEQPETKAYSSLSELPGNMVERHSVEDERFSAAAVFNLSSSDQGVQALLKAGPDMIRGSHGQNTYEIVSCAISCFGPEISPLADS